MEQVNKKQPIKILRWVFLAFSIFLNAFIIVHACLPPSVSAKWSNAFVSFFISIFNASGQDTSTYIKVDDLTLNMDQTYNLNNIPGYLENEVAVEKIKRITYEVSPSNATNKTISYTISDPSIFDVEQKDNYLYLSALKAGDAILTVTSNDNSIIKKEYNLKAVEKVAPPTFTLEENKDVYLGEIFSLPISCGDVDQSYYDLDKLTYQIDDTYFSKYDSKNYEANQVGESSIQVNEKSINIRVLDSSSVIYPTFSNIKGTESLTSYSIYKYEVELQNEPTSKDVIWSISDTSNALLEENGLLRVKDVKEESVVTIKATSRLDKNISITKEITLKPVTITSFELVIPVIGNHITNMPYLGEVGQQIKVWMEDNTGTLVITGVTASSSDNEVAEVYVQGEYLYINCIKVGKTHITVTSINNPNVSKYVDLEVTVKGVINNENYASFSEFVRKSIGHFLLFLVTGIFTFLTFYFFLKDSDIFNIKHIIVFTLFIGLLVATLSEIIQFYVPGRFGSFIDVLTDFGGYVIGSMLTWLIAFLIKKHKKKKDDTKNIE